MQSAWQEYSYLLRSSTLEWLTEEAFDLKVDLTINDLEGQRIDSGTAEERWGTLKAVTVSTQFVHESSDDPTHMNFLTRANDI